MELVERSRLKQRFMDGLDKKLTLIEAPLGYGKSTFIKSLVEALQDKAIPVQYVMLDVLESGHLHLVTHALAELGKTHSLEQEFFNSGHELNDVALNAFIDGLTDLPAHCCLIIDDFHEAERATRHLVQSLLRHDISNLHLILGSREPPKFPLTKLRMADQVTDFGLSDLRFNTEEANLLFGGNLQQSEVQAYVNRTEGWVAALQLMRQSHTSSSTVQPTFSQLSDFADYLNEQYFDQLSSVQQYLLLNIAHVSKVDGDLAIYLTSDESSWSRLEQLASTQALIYRETTGDKITYRFHQLLRDFLLGKQQQMGKEALNRLHIRTANWFADNSHLYNAMRHACLAEKRQWAAEILLENGGVQFGFLNGAARLAPCLDLLSPDLIYSEPRLIIIRAYLFLKRGRIQDASEILINLRNQYNPDDLELEREIILVESHLRLYRDTPVSDRQLEALEHTIVSTPVTDPLSKGLLSNFLCMFLIEKGDFVKAQATGEDAMAFFTDIGADHLQFFMHLHLSAIDLEIGNIDAALEKRQKAADIYRTHFSFDPSLRAITDVYIGEINFELGILDELTRTLLQALAGVDRHEGWNMLYLAGYETCLSQLISEDRFDDAVELLEKAGNMVSRRGIVLFSNQIKVMELDLSIRVGAKQEATRLAVEVSRFLADPIQDSVPRWRGRIRALLALAKFEKEFGEVSLAIDYIRQVLIDCETNNLVRLKSRALVSKFLIEIKLKDPVASENTLKAYLLGVRLHKDYGACIRERREFNEAALSVVAQNGLGSFQPEQIRCLADCIWRASGRSVDKDNNMFQELLTEKEYFVLLELAKGSANKVIARALEITEPTVKFHLKNIYQKIGVNSRKLAIELAKEYGNFDQV